MKSLLSTESVHGLRIIEIRDVELARNLSTYGIFKNSYVTKLNPDDSRFPVLKISCKNGTIAIPGHLAKYIKLRLSKSNEKEIYDIEEGKTGTVSHIEDEKNAIERLSRLGIETGIRIKILRQLPHMEYVVLVNSKRRIHLPESIAATIVGTVKEETKQLSFSRRGRTFIIKDIVQEKEYTTFLSNSGIVADAILSLEGIEAGKDIVFDEDGAYIIYTMEGYRLTLSTETASKIMVVED